MPDMTEYVLYSGGLKGAEAEFGKNAERWGIREVTFTYEGHKPERTISVRELSGDELKKGDISMEIVSTLMDRTYSKADKIRKVMQCIFHVVNNGYQVFAVGWIQPNGTVKGGTGWGVELAKLFNRPVSVFDQDRKAWFTWKDGSWTEDQPVIGHKTFSGTGTRFLSEEGRQAINDLYERSFGQPA